MVNSDSPRTSVTEGPPKTVSAPISEPPSEPLSEPPSLSPPATRPTSSEDLVKTGRNWILTYFSLSSIKDRASTRIVLGIGTLTLMALKFVVVPLLASRAANIVAEGYGIDMEVKDWSASLLDLNASAKEVSIRVPGKYAQAELLTIDELELDLSLWRRLRGKGWVDEVRVKGPKLYFERQLSGAWNWQELGAIQSRAAGGAQLGPDGIPTEKRVILASNKSGVTNAAGLEPEDSAFAIRQLRIEDMQLKWVENLPGDSGGGLINEQRATLNLDDMTLSALDLRGLQDPRPQPTGVNVDARAADGKISMAGQANFFAWGRNPSEKGEKSTPTASQAWSPSFTIHLYLENLGAGAFARLTPEVAIRPARGTISGTVELALNQHEQTCTANVDVRDVTFAVNRSSPLLARRSQQVESEVARLRPVSGHYQFACGGLASEAGFRPIQAFLSQVTRRTLDEANAPITVRAAAAADHTRYTTQPLDRESRSTVASMVNGVDAKLVGFLEVADRVGTARKRVSETFGGLPGGFIPSFP